MDELLSEVRSDIKALSKDIDYDRKMIDRLDINIIKLTELSTAVHGMLAVHENKLTAQEKLTEALAANVEKRREENEDNFRQLQVRIDQVKKEIKEEFENITDDVLSELRLLRTDINSKQDKIDTSIKESIKDVNDKVDTNINRINSKIDDTIEKTDKRISRLEKMSIAIGGGLSLAYVIYHFIIGIYPIINLP